MPVVHAITELYSALYALGHKIPKRDRFGLHAKIEAAALSLLEMTIAAVFEEKNRKRDLLKDARLKGEILKRLIRLEREHDIIPEKRYIDLESRLQEISKMVNGWIKYLG